MAKNPKTMRDAFNLLCGDKIGGGQYRDVFECRLNADWVVKVDAERARWCNVQEFEFWERWKDIKPVARWLAPCHFLSPDGRILIQSRTAALNIDKLPKHMPDFLTDMKPCNYGKIRGKVVCHDYAMVVSTADVKLRKAKWKLIDHMGKSL